jgi:ubiquinone/menaquinone biosynthesis C-methylase UbiE
MNQQEFKQFFEPYSKNVDNANNLGFWKLSDRLIFEIIKKHIPIDLNSNKVIFDAGGGTGRWICDLSRTYKSKFILYDLSEDMLRVASQNIKKAGIEKRAEIMQGNLENIDKLAEESVDYIISIYSPISFVQEKERVAKELYRILKKDGKILIMGHGFYNALASKINNYCAPAGEISAMRIESSVKWNEYVPKLNIFSKESMERLLNCAGFISNRTYGVPVFAQPGTEDFDPQNEKKSKLSKSLSNNSDFFDEVLRLEMEYSSLPNIANRGVNIFSVATK